MRILIGWDHREQAETIALFLSVEQDEATLAADENDVLRLAETAGPFDVCLLALGTPDIEHSYQLFRKLRQVQPDLPIVGACQPSDVFRMARFLMQGLRQYILRDSSGDFVFLLRATLWNTVEAVRAERERLLAEKLREEINSVRKLQESILPQDVEAPPGYQIAARYEPSQLRVYGGQPVVMAGGDYYEVSRVDREHTVIMVGDASGHGMKACMSIITMHTLINLIRSQNYCDAARFMSQINNRLCAQSFIQTGGGFITAFYGVLNTVRHELTWTSAGHPVPLLYQRRTGELQMLGPHDAGGLPLGLYEDADYECYTSPLPPISRLVIYTDGLVEAFGEDEGRHREFGLAGVRQTLHHHRHSSTREVLDALFDDSQAITGGMGRHDDTSIVVVDRLP
ncbi:MAG: hypothetical protein KatS3mg114_0724 [Planctomycetaceae bacterium]|nr:MAG: hypothetical protein KatS3mg114_0724 [Planctomycetaceae bacterium]